MGIFWAMLLKPLVALALFVPAIYLARVIHRRMKPGRLKTVLFKQIN